MARKSQALIAAESEIAQLKTQVGVLMSQLEASNQRAKALQDERDFLIIENERLTEAAITVAEELDAAKERIAKQGQVIAAQPKSAPTAAPKSQAPAAPKPALKPLPAPAEYTQAIQVTDTDRRVWAAFKALPREKRQSYYDFAHATVGHLGIDNIQAVREAYLAKQAVA